MVCRDGAFFSATVAEFFGTSPTPISPLFFYTLTNPNPTPITGSNGVFIANPGKSVIYDSLL